MSEFVTDTQMLVWFMEGRRLKAKRVQKIFVDTDLGRNIIHIPAVVMMEMLYLFERARIGKSILDLDALIVYRISIHLIAIKLAKILLFYTIFSLEILKAF